MIELIVAHPHAFWLSLGGLLLAAEMLGGNGYLLWSGVAAVITGLVVWLLPVGWEWQGALFAVLTLLAAAVVALAEQTGEGAEAGRRASQSAWAADRG